MANTVIQLKKSSTPSQVPGDLANGELAINYADGKLYYKNSTGQIVSISSAGGGDSFGTVVANGTLLVADTTNDYLTINQSDNIIITTDALTNTMNISASLVPANAYAGLVGAAGNANLSVATIAANSYAASVGVAANAYTDTVVIANLQIANAYSRVFANSVGSAANAWANTKLSNTSGVVFEGNLNIKTDLWIGNNITNVTSLIFNTSTNRTPVSPGELTWSQDDSTLHFDMDSPSNVIGHIGQDLFYYVKNQTGSTITKGSVVRFAGTLGASGRILIQPAIANNSYPSKYVMGVAAASIADGADGFVISQGKVRGIDTSMFSAGDILYVSPSTAGAFSNTMPTAPNNKITIASVINSDNIQGSIEVRVTLGSKINEDELVELSGLSDGDVLVYKSSPGRFENRVQLALNAGSVDGLTANTIMDSANGYARVFANSVGTAGNAYTDTVVTANLALAKGYANTYVDTVVVANLAIANAYSRVFANSVGTAGNANLSVATVAANNFAGSMANSVNAYTSATYSTITFASGVYDKANGANVLACTAFDKANSAVRTGFTSIGGITPSSNAATLNIYGANIVSVTANTTNNALIFSVAQTAVTATTYGASDTTVPYFTVDAYGRITAAGNTTVANAKTMLQNTTVTLAGALTTTGQMYANAQLTVNPTDGTQEGGQVDLKGAAAYPTWSIDSYQNSLRFFNANTGYQSVYIFNSSTGTINVGINRSTSSYAVDVVGSVNASAVLVNGVAVGGGGLTVNNETASASSFYPLFSSSSTGSIAYANVTTTKLSFVPSTGTLSATIFNSLSDQNQKTNIKKINNALETMKLIDGVSFNWKDNGNKSYGVIAQDVEKIIPEIVSENDGNKSVNYDAIIGFLIETVKELSDKIDKLENDK